MSEPIARLIELHGGRPGRAHELSLGAHVLGRDASADVVLVHADVSRHHAELEITPDGATVRDLGSKNGIVVDGRKLEQAVLEDGSLLTLGEFGLRLEHHGARVDRLLARSGEPTVRRPRELPLEPAGAAARPQPSLALPLLAALAFVILLSWLLVFG